MGKHAHPILYGLLLVLLGLAGLMILGSAFVF
jgi:hypothetical protein